MAIVTDVVVFNSTSRKHVPIPAGDKLSKAVVDFSPPTLSYVPGTGVLTVTHVDGTVQNVTLTSIAADKFLSGSAYNATTGVLTLTLSDATTVTVSLADLAPIVPGNTGNVKFTGTGTTATPLVGNLDLVAGAAPAVVDNGTTPTIFFGANASALGTPSGWATVLVGTVAKRVPYYD